MMVRMLVVKIDGYNVGLMSLDEKDCIVAYYRTELANKAISRPSWWERDKNANILYKV